MHIDFVLPVEHDLMRGFEEWKVWQGCRSCGRGVKGVGLGCPADQRALPWIIHDISNIARHKVLTQLLLIMTTLDNHGSAA